MKRSIRKEIEEWKEKKRYMMLVGNYPEVERINKIIEFKTKGAE